MLLGPTKKLLCINTTYWINYTDFPQNSIFTAVFFLSMYVCNVFSIAIESTYIFTFMEKCRDNNSDLTYLSQKKHLVSVKSS